MPGGNCRPPVISRILSARAASALPRASLHGGDDQVFEDLALFRLEQRRVDPDRLHLALAGHGDGDEAGAGGAGDLKCGDLLLHGLHFGLQFLRLLHHAHEIAHRHRSQLSSSAASSGGSGVPSSAAVPASSVRTRTSTISAPGKCCMTAATTGSARASLTRRRLRARAAPRRSSARRRRGQRRSSSARRSTLRASSTARRRNPAAHRR